MEKIIAIVNRMTQPSNKRWVIAGYFLSIALLVNPWFGTTHLKVITNGLGMIDMHAFNIPSRIYDYIAQLGIAGQRAYMTLLAIDVVFFIDLACLQMTLFNTLFKKTFLDQYQYTAILLVIGRVVSDILENCLMIVNIRLFPEYNKVLLWMTTTATALKWFLLVVSILMLLLLLGLFLANKCNQRNVFRE